MVNGQMSYGQCPPGLGLDLGLSVPSGMQVWEMSPRVGVKCAIGDAGIGNVPQGWD